MCIFASMDVLVAALSSLQTRTAAVHVAVNFFCIMSSAASESPSPSSMDQCIVGVGDPPSQGLLSPHSPCAYPFCVTQQGWLTGARIHHRAMILHSHLEFVWLW